MLIVVILCGIFSALGNGAELPADDGAQVQLIGADDITQVAAAQALGLSGRGVRVCVIDGPIDIGHPTFGNCRAPGNPLPPDCRVYTAYNADTKGEDVAPLPGSGDTHGTHCAGIAVGSFPFKLRDKDGQPLPHQRGVAYGALLGAFNFGAFGRTDDCMRAALQRSCNVVSMSFGLSQRVAASYPQPDEVVQLKAFRDAGVIAVAAASNDGSSGGGSSLFSTSASPGSLASVLSVASIENTAQPGTLLQLDRAIPTSAGVRSVLEATVRVDTPAITYDPLNQALGLPQQLVLLRTTPRESGCVPLTAVTKTSSFVGKVFVLQIAEDCVSSLYEDVYINGPGFLLWETYTAMRPALTLFALPTDAAALESAGRLHSKGMPMLWLRSDDGRALAAALAAEPARPLSLLRLPGATLSPLPPDQAGQPLDYSSMGPTLEFGVKPDIAAPGTLFSSTPDQTYAPMTGTSMACPYVAGVVALWREQMAKAGSASPPEDWVAAASAALKNTAKPLPFPGSSLMYPPAKIGAGLVQAYAAMVTSVSVTPTELPLRTDVNSQMLQLNLTNRGNTAVTYTVGHKPAVGLSLTKAWYRKAYDPSIPSAMVSLAGASVTVPAKGSILFKVTVSLSPSLRQLDDAIVSGYITFTPSSSSNNSSVPAAVPLSIPYQGASRDYSSLGSNTSLALFARPLPSFDPVAATMVQGRPLMYLCSPASYQHCEYTPGAVAVGQGYGIRIAATFVRPVKQVRVQVYDAGNNTHLGTKDFGACRATSPVEVGTLNTCDAVLFSDATWFGEYRTPNGSNVEYIEPGMYRLRALLYAPLAAAEAAAGRQPRIKPYVVAIPNLLHIIKEG